MAEKKRNKKKDDLFREEMGIDVYNLARQGYSNLQISKVLGINVQKFYSWIHTKPTIKYALEKGRHELKDPSDGSFSQYIYNQLSPRAKDLWDRVLSFHEEADGIQKIEALFAEEGKKMRQQLFLHAWITYGFNASEALKAVNISRTTLNTWMIRDPDFAELVDEVHWHKGNFFEGALIDLVKRGDSSAVIFANKTYNRNRGYSEKVEVEMKDGVPKTQINVQINNQEDSLKKLSFDELLKLKEIQNKLKQENKEEPKMITLDPQVVTVQPKVIDVEVEEVKDV